ncbi:unnamed protein product [Boreogadus saida]
MEWLTRDESSQRHGTSGWGVGAGPSSVRSLMMNYSSTLELSVSPPVSTECQANINRTGFSRAEALGGRPLEGPWYRHMGTGATLRLPSPWMGAAATLGSSGTPSQSPLPTGGTALEPWKTNETPWLLHGPLEGLDLMLHLKNQAWKQDPPPQIELALWFYCMEYWPRVPSPGPAARRWCSPLHGGSIRRRFMTAS